MRNHNSFSVSGKSHLMVADDVTAAQCRKADGAGNSRTGMTLTSPHGDVFEVLSAGVCNSFAHSDGCSTGRIDFTVMVHFKDFCIVVFEQFRGEFKKLVGYVYACAHVRRKHNRYDFGGFFNCSFAFCIQPCSSDDHADAGVGADLQKFFCAFRTSEVD